VLIGGGSLALLYAVVGAIGSRDMRLDYLRFTVFVTAGHELLLIPLALGAGVLIGRYIPVTVRRFVQTAVILSVFVTVVALPALIGDGRSPDLPSALPRDYTRGWLILLALIWLGTLAAAAVPYLLNSVSKPSR
jgi:hypothetical protein